ncbi:hypothetical protein D3C76_1079430 [compost metagenome]
MADDAVAQGDLLILFAHFVLTDAHLSEDKMCPAERHFRVVGHGKFDALAVVANYFFDHWRDGVLACGVDVVEANFRQREILQLDHQAFHNARRVSAAATGNGQNKGRFKHVWLLQRNVSTASRIFLTCSP